MMKQYSFFALASVAFYGKYFVIATKSFEDNYSSLRGRAAAALQKERKLQAKCGCSSCTDDVLETFAGAYKCGDRINWLTRFLGFSEVDACTVVAGEFSVECGGCNPDSCSYDEEPDEPEEPPYDEAYECGCNSCTEVVWNTLAGGYSCGSRITWLQEQDVAALESYGITNGPFDKAAACTAVSMEFPDICTCNPTTCDEEDPTPQTSAPTSSPTITQTLAPTEYPTWMPTETPTDTPTAGPTDPSIDEPDEPEISGNCGCNACTQEVFDTYAGRYKCGDRINWVNQYIISDREQACIYVAEEFPEICGVCHSETCGER